MSVKHPFKFRCATLKSVAGHSIRRHGLLSKRYTISRLGMQGLNPVRSASYKAASVMPVQEPTRWNWNLQVDVERTRDDFLYSLPMLLYVYSPWQFAITKWNIWKLQIFWDWHFSESQFVDTSKRAVVLITNYIRQKSAAKIRRCTTPMGYKQIMHDMVDWKSSKSRIEPQNLLRFERRHIRRAILLKVQKLPHYDHKFAFMDVIFLAFRRTNDFSTDSEIKEMSKLIDSFVQSRKLLVPYPIVFAELFVRFRRDYSSPATIRSGHWLISTYKILKLDMLNYHPEFYVSSQRSTEDIRHSYSADHNKL